MDIFTKNLNLDNSVSIFGSSKVCELLEQLDQNDSDKEKNEITTAWIQQIII